MEGLRPPKFSFSGGGGGDFSSPCPSPSAAYGTKAERESLADIVDSNGGNWQLLLTSVSHAKHRLHRLQNQEQELFQTKFNYYSYHDATYQLELYILSSGDIHPNPVNIYQPRVPGNNNNNSRTMKLSVFYANTRSIVNQIAKPQIKIASSVFDVIKKKKLGKQSPAARVPTAFLVLPNFHSCFYLTIRPVGY